MIKDKSWRFNGNERKYLDEVLKNGFGASESGSMNEKLERKFAEIHNKKYAITANSGTSTLHMALNAFGVRPGDEVIIPALTVAMCGFAVWHIFYYEFQRIFSLVFHSLNQILMLQIHFLELHLSIFFHYR